MQLGPDVRAGTEGEQSDALAAVAEGQHEQPRTPVLAALRVARHRAGAVIDLGLFARRGDDHRAGFRPGGAAQFAYEAFDARILAGEAVIVDQVLPNRLGIPAPGEPQFDRLAVGFAGTGGGAATRGWLWDTRRAVAQSRGTPLWPVLPAAVPSGLMDRLPPRRLAGSPPLFPGGRRFLAGCAAGTIPGGLGR